MPAQQTPHFTKALVLAFALVTAAPLKAAPLHADAKPVAPHNTTNQANLDGQAANSPPLASPTHDNRSLAREIITRLQRVPEFEHLRQLAQQHKINKVYLFGGTAAAWAHYIRWSLEYENQKKTTSTASTNTVDTSAVDTSAVDTNTNDTTSEANGVRFNAMILDYNLGSLIRWNQDVDLVVDHPNSNNVQAFQNALEVLNTELQRKVYELRSLHHDYGDKPALAKNNDFLNQNTDSMSTTLIELYSASPQTKEKGLENFEQVSGLGETNVDREHNDLDKFIDLRHPGSNQFLIDVAAKHISCYYDDTKHKTTTRHKEGNNPDIFFAIRVLNKVFQYDLSLNADCYQTLKSIFANFTEQHLTNDYTHHWLNKNAKKLYQNALNLEQAHNILKDLGALEVLQKLKSDKLQELVLLMNRQPLLSWPLADADDEAATISNHLATNPDHKKPPDDKGPTAVAPEGSATFTGTARVSAAANHDSSAAPAALLASAADRALRSAMTAGELGIQYVTHCTQSAREYAAITASPTLQVNVFISRPGTKGEAATDGPGFYTLQGLHTECFDFGQGLWPVWFRVDPHAQQGVDFDIIQFKSGKHHLVFKNKEALKIMDDTSEYEVDFETIELFQHWVTSDAATSGATTSGATTNNAVASNVAITSRGRKYVKRVGYHDWTGQSANSQLTQPHPPVALKNIFVQLLTGPANTTAPTQTSNPATPFDLLQVKAMQSRLRRYIIADLKKHPEKRQTLAQLANHLLNQHLQNTSTTQITKHPQLAAGIQITQNTPAATPQTSIPQTSIPQTSIPQTSVPQSLIQPHFEVTKTQPTLISKNPDFWQHYFELPFDDLSFDFLTYLKHLAQHPDSVTTDYNHKAAVQAMQQKMHQHFQRSQVDRQQLIQLAQQLAQNNLSFFQHQNFWRAYIGLGLNLENFDLVTYFQDLADWYRQPMNRVKRWHNSKAVLQNSMGAVNTASYVNQNTTEALAAATELPYLHIDVENFLFYQAAKIEPASQTGQAVQIKNSALTGQTNKRALLPKRELKAITEQLIQQRPSLSQAPAFWLSYLKLPLYMYLTEPVQQALKNETSAFAQSLRIVLNAPTSSWPLWPLVHAALESKQLDGLKVAFSLGFDTDAQDESGHDGLYHAIDKGYLEGAQFFINKGSDFTTALIQAAHKAYIEMVQLLLSAGADPNATNNYNETALEVAIKSSNVEASRRIKVIQTLLAAGADPNYLPDYSSYFDYTALHIASGKGDKDVVQILLAAGADPNNKHSPALKATLLNITHDTEILQILLAAGADPNLQDNDGDTALHWAAKRGNVKSIQLLLAAGTHVNVNIKNSIGQTPLMQAASYKYLKSRSETIEVLLAAGADPNLQDHAGRTALYFAAALGVDASIIKGPVSLPRPDNFYTIWKKRPWQKARKHLALSIIEDADVCYETLFRDAPFKSNAKHISTLLAAGADPNLSDATKMTLTPLMIASLRGYFKAVEVLLNAGADPSFKLGPRGAEIQAIDLAPGQLQVYRDQLQKSGYGHYHSRDVLYSEETTNYSYVYGLLSDALRTQKLAADQNITADQKTATAQKAAVHNCEQLLTPL